MIDGNYSEAEWQAIVDASQLSDPGATNELRTAIDSVLMEFCYANVDNQLMRPAGRNAQAWEKVARSAAKLASDITALETKTLPTGFGNVDPEEVARDDAHFDDLIERLRELEARARANEARYRKHALHFSGRKDPTRQTLFEQLLSVWTDKLGRDLKYSRPGGGPPGGPLLRFLAATLQPVLGDQLPKLEGLASIIDREAERRQALEPSKEVV